MALKNAKVLLEKVKNGTADYQFIEIMACPGGCIGGGGNPPKTWSIMEKRKKAIYEAEAELPVRQSHKNPAIQKIYETYLGEPCGELSHSCCIQSTATGRICCNKLFYSNHHFLKTR